MVALCGATVVVGLDPPEVVSSDLLLAGNRVHAIGPAPAGVTRRDCAGTLILPGNVCAHHHLYSALSRGMPYHLAPPGSFTEILQRIWWRLDRALDEESIRASAMSAGLDALRAGTTTIIDHHASPNAVDGSLGIIADALGEIGVRAVLCYEVTDRDGLPRAAAGIAENLRFIDDPRPLARGMLGAHASFTLSDDTLAALAGAARATGVGVHIHVAEAAADQRDAQARSGGRVVGRLYAAELINDRALLAHCVHLDPAEIDVVIASGATVVCNPRSNMNNAVGYSPFNRRGGRIALGTDGIDGDMFAEAQTGFLRTIEAGPARSTWPLTRLAEGARFAGRVYDDPLLGTLRAGAPADLVVLEYPAPTPLTADNLAGHWVFGLSRAQVRDVYVDGNLVVAERASTRVDEAKVAADSQHVAQALWARLDSMPAHDFAPRGGGQR